MIGKPLQDMLFIWAQVWYHGHLKKQPIVTISSAEAKYAAATTAACHAVWLRRILYDLVHVENEPTPFFLIIVQ